MPGAISTAYQPSFQASILPGPVLSPLMQVSLIDFTASRLVTGDGQLAFCDLSQDPEVFEGPSGEVQVKCLGV
jgi:hypothetical protein